MKRQLEYCGNNDLKSEQIDLRTCYECRGVSEGRRENYNYSESGLKNVVLENVIVHRCNRCGAESVEIPNMDGLHRTLALGTLCKRSLLSADEIRFLRSVAGFSATELARSIGVTKVAVSRWENSRAKIGGQSDKAIRLICGLSILEAIVEERAGFVNKDDLKEVIQKLRRFFTQFSAKSVLSNIQEESLEPEKLLINPEQPFNFSLLPMAPLESRSEALQ